MNRLLPLVAALAVMAATFACKTSDEQGCFVAVDTAGWNYGDTLRFDLGTAEDSVIDGRLALVVRHTAGYAYSNLWLEVSYPAADSLSPDTFNVRLSNSFGDWYGKGLGLSYQLTDTVGRRLKLSTPATLSVRHIMRVDRLEDIEQIGVLILPD